MKHTNARAMRLALAKKMRGIAEDLEYKPAEDECVEVETHLFHELAHIASLIADYQGREEAMLRLTRAGDREENEQMMKILRKSIEEKI